MVYIAVFIAIGLAILICADLVKYGAKPKPQGALVIVILTAALLSTFKDRVFGPSQGWIFDVGVSVGMCILLYLCAIFGEVHWRERGVLLPIVRPNWRLSRSQLKLASLFAVVGAVYSLAFDYILGIPVGELREGVGCIQVLALYGSAIGPAIAEEIVFRYYLQGRIGNMLKHSLRSDAAACVIAAVAFTVMHLDRGHTGLRWLQVLPLGLGFGALFLRGGLPVAIVCHALTNAFIYTFVILKK